jgi:sugar phosphate isomerase/epimerase
MTPDYPAEEVARKIKEMGYEGVEWALAYENAVWDPSKQWHISWENMEEDASRVKEISNKYGLEICSLGSSSDPADFEKVEKIFKCAKILGSPQARIGSARYDGKTNYNEILKKVKEDYKTVVKIAEDYGVKALIEIHPTIITPSASSTYCLLEGFNPRYVGAIFDPGNMVKEGWENFKMGIEILGDYLAHVHVKNQAWFYREIEGKKKWVCDAASLSKGIVDWKEVLMALRSVGYKGYLSLEDFRGGYCEIPKGITTEEKLEEDINYLRTLEKEMK